MNRILIAEDESRISKFLEKGLKANGFTTAVVKDSDEAVLMASSDNFDLLILDILRNPEQVMSREQLLNYVWGYDYHPGSNIVDVYVGYLRKKLGGDLIETVRGMGYRLRT